MAESKHVREIAADKSLADEALKRADSQELFAIFERMVHRYAELETAFEVIVKHYTGSKDAPRHHPPMDAIKAMESVALAAIGLARSVSGANDSKFSGEYENPAVDAVARTASNQHDGPTRV